VAVAGPRRPGHGSKLAALWIDRQLYRTRHASLREVFQSELQLGTNIVRHPEFAEGVRALLIDKDRNPAWAYASSRDVPTTLLESFFTRPGRATPWPICEGREEGRRSTV
jgi:hypothetical protein